MVELPYQFLGGFEFAVPQYGVQRYINAGAIQVSKIAQPCNVVNRVARSRARSKIWSANIHRVSAVFDGLNAGVGIAGRCE